MGIEVYKGNKVGTSIMMEVSRELALRKAGVYKDTKPKKSREQINREFSNLEAQMKDIDNDGRF